ncbi:MAG: hypothetical protein PHD68_02165 [Rugosibacter sp.]|nr:hypothetical protein [Rugosibacter sp.]
MKDIIPMEIGILAARFAKKRLGPAADDYDPTTWNVWSDVKGAAGAVAGGLIANAIKPGTGQKVMLGGLLYIADRIVRNNIINQSPWAIAQFGADEEQGGEGMYVDESGDPYASTAQGMMPLTEEHRALPTGSAYGYGDSLVTPSALGGRLEPIGPMGYLGQSNDFREFARSYYAR